MCNYPKKQLALPIALAVTTVTTLPALADEAVANMQTEEQAIEEVVVIASPIRDSQKAALQAKKAATNFVDIIAADTIGRFPDQNLADSLGRVPGVAIERDQGQARYINFRGAPFKYSPIAIDGVVIPGAENGRVARFDSFPSVITSRLIANKAITPNMPGDAVSGFINIETHDPFKFDGFAFNADLGFGQQELGGGDITKTILKASYSNENWGGMIYTSKNSREQITDNREYDWLAENQLGGVEFRSYEVTREDEAFGGKLEYRFNNSAGRIFASVLESEFNDHELRNQYALDIEGGMEEFSQSAPTGKVNDIPLALVERWLQDGDYKSSTSTKTLGFEYNVKGWLLEGRVSSTSTENYTHIPLLQGVGGSTSLSYDVTDLEDPKAELYQVNSTTAPQALQEITYSANVVLNSKSEMDIDATQIKFDVTKDMSLFGLNSEVQFGFNADTREAQGYGFYMDFSNASLYGFMGTGIEPADYDTGVAWDSDFANGIGGTIYDNEALRSAWEAQVGDLSDIDIPEGDLIIIDETITAVYAMATSYFDWGNLVYGARIEQTDYTSQGPTGTFEDDYIHVLPSLHVNYDLANNQKLRWSLTTGVSRPNYGEWRATTSIIPISTTISAGNPELEAEETLGTDISYEWYIGDASMLSTAAFYRSIDKVIYVNANNVDGSTIDSSLTGTWSHTQSVNGEEGSLSGLEVNFIAYASDFIDVLDGFGASVNYTMLDSEFTTLTGEKYSLPGTSENIYNASIFYEAHGLSARLNYQYRDDWFSTTENASEPEYWSGQQRADFSLSYALPNDIYGAEVSFYFNANNLTDAVDTRYVGSEATPNQVERYGKRYMAGVRVNY